MGTNLWWFYDAVIIGIALICLYVGARRGLMRSIVLVVLTLASIGISWLGSQVASPIIYDKLLKTPITNGLIDASNKTDPISVVGSSISDGGYGVEMTDDEIEGVISQNGDFFTNIAGELKTNGASASQQSIGEGMEESVTELMLKALIGDVVSPAVVEEILSSVKGAEKNIRSAVDVFLNGDKTATAEAVERNIVAPAAKFVLKGVIWSLLMIILLLVSRLVARLFEAINEIPVIGPVNSLLGGVLGCLEALVFIYIIAQIVRLVCYFTSDSLMFLNSGTVQQTYLFKYIYNFDIMNPMG